VPRPTAKRETAYGDVIRQYLDLRDDHPGIMLLFRIGSFYEVLFEDAELVARELGLKLSERPSGGAAPPVPQCGFAHHALDNFLPRLLARGYRVAVCEESEEESSGMRQRAVVRTLTPGTVTDPRLLKEERPTYLVAIATDDHRMGLAWTDVAAGEFKAGEFDLEDAAAEVQRLDPAEILVPSDRPAPESLTFRRNVTSVGPSRGASEILKRAFPQTSLADLPHASMAAGLVIRYLEETQGADTPALESPQEAGPADFLRLDATTQRHLELVETERNREVAGSLLGALDRAVTPMGRRMLRGWLLRPLTHLGKITVRQRLIAELVAYAPLRAALAAQLGQMTDLERLVGRAAAHRATLDDLRALSSVARQLPSLAQVASQARSSFLRSLGTPRRALASFAERAAQVLPPDDEEERARPVRGEASPGLAQALIQLTRTSEWQTRYLGELRRLPGLGKVKLERTTTQGLFLEVPVNTSVPRDWVRRGGLQKVERYATEALEQHAIEVETAEALVAQETKAVLDELRTAAASVAAEARELARTLAATDALLSLATVAVERGWIQPVVDTSATLTIEGGRHPVIEGNGPFQPNDTQLEGRGELHQLVVLTGPNMAGKSTWMRQVALLTLLAQVGSFVPATSAHIGMVDAIFTRIGAVDDLAGGRSTFMVEMLETASVLQGATDRSLVLLDEIGRGTSTHDGMAIAWAVIEYLANGPARPRAIVATHYHELAALQSSYPQITLLKAAVEERPDGIDFPHRIEPGAADRSFGIEVARLAGLPDAVLSRARQVSDAVEPLSADITRHLGTVGGTRKK